MTGDAFPIQPLDDRVIVRLVPEPEEKTPRGIIVARTAQEIPQRGVIVAVGPGAPVEADFWGHPVARGSEIRFNVDGVDVKRRPMPVKVGDIVYFARYAGTEFKVRNEDYLALRERDLIGLDTRGLQDPSVSDRASEAVEATVP